MPPQTFKRQDALALPVLAVGFAALLAGTWQRWTQPLIDHGREMNLPARIAAGERLYVDVQFLYGPLAPYVNAALYKIFGVHLGVLKTSGVICAVVILFLIYWIARRLMMVWEATATTALVMTICAIKSTGNLIQPYAYAALYALVLSLGSLAATLAWLKGRSAYRLRAASGEREDLLERSTPPEGGALTTSARWLVLAGALSGLALITKPEMALAALAAAGAAWLVASVTERRVLWRDGFAFAVPALAIFVVTWAWVLSRVPWRVLVEENYVLFYTLPPPLIYFNRQISGLGAWPRSGWFTLAGVGVFLVWLGVSILLGAGLKKWSVVSGQRPSTTSPPSAPATNHESPTIPQPTTAYRQLPTALLGLALLAVGVAWQWAAIELGRVTGQPTPFASAALVLPVLLALLGWRVWRGKASERDGALLVIGAFALAAILRALLNLTIAGPYTPFFLPVVIVVYLYLLFSVVPAWCLRGRAATVRTATRRVAVGLVLLMAVGLGINTSYRMRRSSTFTVATERGSFLTDPHFGQPIAAAIQYARAHTRPGEYVLALPQATTINFLADRPYPLPQEIIHPGFVTGVREEAAIERIKALKVPLIIVGYIETLEFGALWFGESYNEKLKAWIAANYRLAARYEYTAERPLPLGKRPFYIEVYELRGGME